MISWLWLVLALFVGTGAGIFLIALLAGGRDEWDYRQGYVEGHKEGFVDGLNQFDKVG